MTIYREEQKIRMELTLICEELECMLLSVVTSPKLSEFERSYIFSRCKELNERIRYLNKGMPNSSVVNKLKNKI